MSFPQADHNTSSPVTSAADNKSTGTHDGRLSLVQVLASALAAVSAAVIASLFGVAGTMIGAALASVVSTVGAAIYSESMRRTHAELRRARSRLPRPQQPMNQSTGAATPPPLAAQLNPRRSPARRWRRRSILAATAVGVFALAMGAVTTVELIDHQPVSTLVGGSGHSSATTLGTLTQALSGQPRSAPVSPGAGVPGTSTASSPPASASSPTGTTSRESAAANASPSTASASSTSAPGRAASTASAAATSAGDQTTATRSPAPTQATATSSTAAVPKAAATAPTPSAAAPTSRLPASTPTP